MGRVEHERRRLSDRECWFEVPCRSKKAADVDAAGIRAMEKMRAFCKDMRMRPLAGHIHGYPGADGSVYDLYALLRKAKS